MERVLVTGATGFVGGHLVDYLIRAGFPVRSVVRRGPQRSPVVGENLETQVADLHAPETWHKALRGMDVVYHVAGQTRALNRRELWQANAQLPNLIAAAAAARQTPPTLVLISTLAAGSPRPPCQASTAVPTHCLPLIASCSRRSGARGTPYPARELLAHGEPQLETGTADPGSRDGLSVDDPQHHETPDAPSARHPRSDEPISLYGASKRAGELAVCRWADRIPISIVRPGIVCGPRNLELWPLFQLVARTGCYFVPGSRTQHLAFIDARDLARLVVTIAQHGKRVSADHQGALGLYDACLPEFPTHAELATHLAHAVGRRTAWPIAIPTPLLWTVAAVGQQLASWRGRPFALTLDKVREATAGSWIGNATRICEELPFEPDYSLAAGLHDTAQWYRQQGWI